MEALRMRINSAITKSMNEEKEEVHEDSLMDGYVTKDTEIFVGELNHQIFNQQIFLPLQY